MKGVRSFLVLLVVAIGLGAFVYYDSKKAPGDEKKQEKVFADVAADKIEQVTVKTESGEQTTLQKQGTAWQVTQPATVPADEAEISGITTNLSNLEVQRVVDDQATDFTQYGLDPARIDVAFKAGGKDHRLLLGQKTPTGADMYAKLPGAPRVFLVSSYLDATFNKTAFDLRDKTILKIDRDTVDRVELQTPGRTVSIAKQGAEWRITSPSDARADFGAVEGIVGRLNTSPMKSIVEDPKDLKEYGLDAPIATVRVGTGSSQAGLAIGKSAGDGVVYAKDLSRPMIFTVDAALADELKKPAEDFRIKDLFDARAFNTTRVEATRAGQTVAFEKDKDAWKQVTPAAKPADTAKVEALLTALAAARATGFEEKMAATGLDTPEVTVALKFDEGKQEKVTFARKDGQAFARREGDTAAKIDAATLDEILKALDGLK